MMESLSNLPIESPAIPSVVPDSIAPSAAPVTEEAIHPTLPTIVEHSITDDLDKLLNILPTDLRDKIQQHPRKADLVEVIMDLGRKPEIRFSQGAEDISEDVITHSQIEESITHLGDFGGDNRAGIERTLHRISAMRNRRGEVIGLTCRVGRAVFGTIGMIRDLVESGQSILMLGRPGVGKTTALREIARVLADDLGKRVVIIDSSNEIAGDGDVPHPAIGRARRMQVARPELQHQVMIEAVENHMPEVIIIDEIGTELEAQAARTIAERGVMLVGTAHGNYLDNLIKNPTLSDLVGGIQSVTLGDEEARRRGSQKSVLERKAMPTFAIAVEMQARQKWVVHTDVAHTIDILLRGLLPSPEIRSVDGEGKVIVEQVSGSKTATPPKGRRVVPLGSQFGGVSNAIPPSPFLSQTATPIEQARGWRASGRMNPAAPDRQAMGQNPQIVPSPSALGLRENAVGLIDLPNTDENPLYLYPYGIGRHQLEQAIVTLELPVVLTKDLDSADVVLALRSHVKNHTKLRHLANARQIPIHTLKSNSMPQIAQALRRLMNIDDEGLEQVTDLSLFSQTGNNDELEALEEARLAVEQIVIPKGQPVELLPREATIRRMQHELVERYRLKSSSFGSEPNRRIRIYPA
jgi:stage III sporulation protein SpoIIIAA